MCKRDCNVGSEESAREALQLGQENVVVEEEEDSATAAAGDDDVEDEGVNPVMRVAAHFLAHCLCNICQHRSHHHNCGECVKLMTSEQTEHS